MRELAREHKPKLILGGATVYPRIIDHLYQLGGGGYVSIPQQATLEVAEACSGIRSLVSLLMLAIVLGYFTERRTGARVLKKRRKPKKPKGEEKDKDKPSEEGVGSGVIVSADKDLSQLLCDGDSQWDYARQQKWDCAGVKARYGVTVAVVVSAADRRVLVLRNGIAIGSAPVRIDGPVAGTLTLCNAGHVPVVVVHPDGRTDTLGSASPRSPSHAMRARASANDVSSPRTTRRITVVAPGCRRPCGSSCRRSGSRGGTRRSPARARPAGRARRAGWRDPARRRNRP